MAVAPPLQPYVKLPPNCEDAIDVDDSLYNFLSPQLPTFPMVGSSTNLDSISSYAPYAPEVPTISMGGHGFSAGADGIDDSGVLFSVDCSSVGQSAMNDVMNMPLLAIANEVLDTFQSDGHEDATKISTATGGLAETTPVPQMTIFPQSNVFVDTTTSMLSKPFSDQFRSKESSASLYETKEALNSSNSAFPTTSLTRQMSSSSVYSDVPAWYQKGLRVELLLEAAESVDWLQDTGFNSNVPESASQTNMSISPVARASSRGGHHSSIDLNPMVSLQQEQNLFRQLYQHPLDEFDHGVNAFMELNYKNVGGEWGEEVGHDYFASEKLYGFPVDGAPYIATHRRGKREVEMLGAGLKPSGSSVDDLWILGQDYNDHQDTFHIDDMLNDDLDRFVDTGLDFASGPMASTKIKSKSTGDVRLTLTLPKNRSKKESIAKVK